MKQFKHTLLISLLLFQTNLVGATATDTELNELARPERLTWGQRRLKRLTGGWPSKEFQMDFGDPTAPIFFKDNELWIMSSQETLVWRGKNKNEAWKKFLSAKPPEIKTMNYFRSINSVVTPFLKDEGDDVWDAHIYRLDHQWYLFGGAMTPTTRADGAIWPDDHFSRRVHAFRYENEKWVKAATSIFPFEPHEGFLGHGYGHQIVNDENKKYMFYEKVTHVEKGLPWVTEIFARQLLTPLKLADTEHEILVFNSEFPESAKREFGGALMEGARPFKVNKTWFLSFSAGDYFSDNYGVHLAWSKSVTGPYEIFQTKPGQFTDFASQVDTFIDGRWGAGRGTFFQDPNSKWWVLFHAIPNRDFPNDGVDPKRDIFLAPVSINDRVDPPAISIPLEE